MIWDILLTTMSPYNYGTNYFMTPAKSAAAETQVVGIFVILCIFFVVGIYAFATGSKWLMAKVIRNIFRIPEPEDNIWGENTNQNAILDERFQSGWGETGSTWGTGTGWMQQDYNCPYKIWIHQKLWHKILYLAEFCQYEIGGHLEVENRGSNLFISNIYVPKQVVTSGSYIPDPRTLAKMDPKILPKLKGWFHSHAQSSVFWSATDNDCIENNLSVFQDYCISIVVNKNRNYKIRLDIRENNIIRTYDNLPLLLILERDKKLQQVVSKEIKNKIQKEHFKMFKTTVKPKKPKKKNILKGMFNGISKQKGTN